MSILPDGFRYQMFEVFIYQLLDPRKKYFEIQYSNVKYQDINYPRVTLQVMDGVYRLRFYDENYDYVRFIINYGNEGFVELSPKKLNFDC